jgi:hypothetical protein
MNPLWTPTWTGTLGELIAQTYLLAHGVQAAPPIKDSGNDLIAIRKHSFKAVQVKTSFDGSIDKPEPDKLYHILATVHLPVDGDKRPIVSKALVYLFPEGFVRNGITGNVANHSDCIISDKRVLELWD